MILYLVRHGESLFNAEGRIQGQSDVELSPLGLRQAAAIAEHLGRFPLEAVFCSPLRRAVQTGQPVADAAKAVLRLDDRLQEINAGIFQGLLWAEIEARFPDHAAPWLAQQPDFRIPNGESRRELMQRGRSAFEAIRETGLAQVAVVAHGGILSAALKALLQIPAELNPFSLYNASISKVIWEKRIKLMTLNGMEHLRAAGLDREDRTGNL